MVEVQRADPESRRRLLLLAAVASILGVVVIALFEMYRGPFIAWLSEDSARLPARIGSVLALLAILTVVPLLAFATWLWVFGSRVLRESRFPPVERG
jgi:ABC-type multidrug transport system fused ATPase/permease subunit